MGKTTTVTTLGAALAERGQRVLIVDLDAQACATFSLGLDPEDLAVSSADLLLSGTPPRAEDVTGMITPTDEGVWLLPAAIDLAGADRALASTPGREYAVREAIEPIRSLYDWVLLDCSPSLGIMTVAALTAADEVLIPLQCETLSHRGVGQLLETIADVQRLTNPELRIAGVLPTLFDGRTTHARAVLADLGPRYQVRVFSPISRSVRFAEAPAVGRSVLSTAGTTRGADDYRKLADELLAG